MRARGLPLLVLVLAVGCTEPHKKETLQKVTVTPVTEDAGPAVAEPTEKVEPTAGTKDDILARVFELGTEPSVPKGFGALRPGMTRTAAGKARPKSWGSAWTFAIADEPGVTLRAGRDDGKDDPLFLLSVELVQRDAADRLAEVWGPPALTAYHNNMVCWLARATKLKACHSKDLDHDHVDLVTYLPFADGLAKRSPSQYVSRLGESKNAIARAFPGSIELDDPDDPTQHRLEVTDSTSELNASVAPDRTVFYLDTKDKVVAIHLWYGANDPAVREQVKTAVDAAVKQVKADGDTLVQLRDQDPSAVVVVLDRSEKLQ
jgi:hypothetical protein